MDQITASRKEFTGTNAERTALKKTTLNARDTWLESDTGDEFVFDGNGALGSWVQTSAGGSANTNPNHQAGERGVDVPATSYLSVVNECQWVTPLSATAFTTSAANDACLIGIHILTQLVGTVTVTGFQSSDDVADSILFPIATPINFYPFYGAINTAGALTVTLSSGSDNSDVVVLWRAKK